MDLLSKIIIIYLFIFFQNNENYFDDVFKYYLKIKTISVVIPIFNTEKHLEECLHSVINQTLKSIEIICIDDGSTDNSSEILAKYSNDNRFIIINQKNKGSGFSRNKGINMSKGKYISFLDSDDMYYNIFALENLYDNAKNNRALICGGGIEKLEKVKNRTIAKKTLFNYEGFIKYIDYQSDYDYQRYIYNKNFLRKNKLYFPQYLRYQDPPFFIKTMVTAEKFYAIKNVTNTH